MADQVEVDDDEIRIIGRRNVLERLVVGGGAVPAGVPVLFGSGAPVGIGPLTFAFGGQNLYLPPAYPNIRQPTLSFDNILIH
jgi:hypothetical protein